MNKVTEKDEERLDEIDRKRHFEEVDKIFKKKQKAEKWAITHRSFDDEVLRELHDDMTGNSVLEEDNISWISYPPQNKRLV